MISILPGTGLKAVNEADKTFSYPDDVNSLAVGNLENA
jgi:hypothetical protein